VIGLVVVTDPTAVPPRVAYAIGTSVGDAVTRNRVRRRLRAIVAEANAHGRVPAGSYLVQVRPEAVGVTFSALRDDMYRALGHVSASGRGR
jgi:ribonuclease P protein component